MKCLDDGGSTGIIKKDYNISALGDISKNIVITFKIAQII
jgi:hypothetical protein